MGESYKVIAEVFEIRSEPGKQPCSLYSIGDKFDLSDMEDRAKLCHWAFHSMLPFWSVLRFGGTLPWEPDPDVAYVACPDPNNVVVFKLSRTREQEEKAKDE